MDRIVDVASARIMLHSVIIIVLMATMLFSPDKSHADMNGWRSMTIKYGLAAKNREENLTFQELGMVHTLPFLWKGNSKWGISTEFDIMAGLLQTENKDDSIIVSMGPAVNVSTPLSFLSFFAGIRAGVMTDHEIGSTHLGGAFTFVEEIGILFQVDDYLFADFSYQHMSNAHIYNHNPGIDLWKFGIECPF